MSSRSQSHCGISRIIAVLALSVTILACLPACASMPEGDSLASSHTEIEVETAPVAKTPASRYDLLGEHVEDVCYQLVKAGFTNIEPREDADLRVAMLHKEGDVSRITIDGESSFYGGDEYPPNVRVVVEYHTYHDAKKRTISKDDLAKKIDGWVTETNTNVDSDERITDEQSADVEGDVQSQQPQSESAMQHEDSTSAILLEANVYGEYGWDITVYGGGAPDDTGTRLGWFVPEGTYTITNLDETTFAEQVNYGSSEPMLNDEGINESMGFTAVLVKPHETVVIDIPEGGCLYITGSSGKLELVRQ